MKRLSIFFLAVPAMLALASCDRNECGPDELSGRVITVSSDNVDTKTSIEYELSDYSHLVWNSGDKVAYVTDVDGDEVSIGEVTDGSFEAELPSGATAEDLLYIVYPSDGLEGLNIDKLKMPLPVEQHQDTLGSSKGVTVPMFAVTPVPEEGVNTVNARYVFPAATLRFSVSSSKYLDEKILSVTLEAQDALTGSMVISRPSNSISLISPSNVVTAVIDRPSPIRDGGYIYMNVMRGDYSDVCVTVCTDKSEYVFEGGRFDLTDADASLFKVTLPLDNGTVPVPEPSFKELQEGESFSADSKYLIAYKASPQEYYVASKVNNNKLDRISFAAVDGGIPAEGAVMDYAFTIAPVEGTPYYTLYSDAVSMSPPSAQHGMGYLGAPGGTSKEIGNFFRADEEGVAANPIQYHWEITYEDGTYVITSAYQNVYSIKYSKYDYFFGLCKESVYGASDIVILKLVE